MQLSAMLLVCNLPQRNRRLQIPSAPAELELIMHMTTEVNAVEFSLPERCRRPANCVSHPASKALPLPGIFGVMSAGDGRRVAALSPQEAPLKHICTAPRSLCSASHGLPSDQARPGSGIGPKHAMRISHHFAPPRAPRTSASMASAPGSVGIYCFRGNDAHVPACHHSLWLTLRVPRCSLQQARCGDADRPVHL